MNPPRHKLSYVPLRCCQNIWTWLSHEWNFVNKQGYRESLKDNPDLLRPVVDAATEGVKLFAEAQSDHGTKALFKLAMVLEQIEPPKDGKFGPFTAAEVVNALAGCFEGTPYLKKPREKFRVEPEPPKPRDETATDLGWSPPSW